MAHELDFSRGKAACMVVGKPAWHRLGAVIESAVTSEEAIKHAQLDWTVAQWPVLTHCGPDSAECEGFRANVRTDTGAVLGLVTERYELFQNVEAFDFMDGIVNDKLAMYETAGALFGGRKIWIMASIPRELRVNDDLVRPYVLLTNSHDGSSALRMIPTSVRVVCNNTLNLALNRDGGQGLTIKHTGTLQARVEQARRAFNLVNQRFDLFGEELNALVGKALSVVEADSYFKSLLDEDAKTAPKTLAKIRANFDNERNTLRGIRHTAWAAYNAVSEFADHQKTVRGNAEGRLNSNWFGTSNQLKQRAFNAALALVS